MYLGYVKARSMLIYKRALSVKGVDRSHEGYRWTPLADLLLSKRFIAISKFTHKTPSLYHVSMALIKRNFYIHYNKYYGWVNLKSGLG